MEESLTHCLKDYRNNHCWTSIGTIVRPNGAIAQVYKCSQCGKCYIETLEQIVRVYQ